MISSLAFMLVVTALAAGAVWTYESELEQRADGRFTLDVAGWLLRGVVPPLVVWALLERSFYPPGVPVKALVLGWWPRHLGTAYFFILCWWTTVSFAWVIVTAWRRTGDRAAFWTGFWVTAFFGLPLVGFICLLFGWPGLGFSLALWLGIEARVVLNRLSKAVIQGPVYGGAIGQIKMGRYARAEDAILAQLEKSQDDFAGWMLLAELYAVHFRDVAAADQSIHDLCAQPNVNRSQVAEALHKLADWYLAVDENPVAAREVVEEIEVLYPGTHLALMARRRLNRMPATRADWQAARRVQTVRLSPRGHGPPAAAAAQGFSPFDAVTPDARIAQLRGRIESHPADFAAREELARLHEGPLQQPREAVAQLEELLALGGASSEQRAEWMVLLSTWQLRHLRNGEDGRVTLQQIVRDHPGTPQADAAARRLQAMAVEDRLRHQRMAPRTWPGRIRIEVTPPGPPPVPGEPPPARWD